MHFLLGTETEIDENIANLASGAVATLATSLCLFYRQMNKDHI